MRVPARGLAPVLGCLLAGCATSEVPVPSPPQDHVDATGLSASNLDPVAREYLTSVRQAIAAKLVHPPCQGEWWQSWLWHCSYKTTRVVVLFSIRRDGQLQSVTVREPSEFAAYNDAAVRAVWAAAPFLPIPDAFLGEKPVVTLGLPIEYAAPTRR